MADYLQRIYIDEIEEVESVKHGAYAKYVDIVEIVDSDGEPWEPVPGPDPWDELVKNQAPLVVGNNFAPGTQISGQTGTFVGGNPDTTIYRYRWRWRPVGGNWTNGTWTNSTNSTVAVTYTIPGDHWNYQIQLQSQARDDTVDPVLQVINNSATKVTENRTFGDISVTVNDIAYDAGEAPALTILMNDPIPVVVSHTGNAQPTYTWEARGDYPLMVGSQTASTVLTFPSEGPVTVTCTLADSTTAEDFTSAIINFYVVDAFD